MRQGVVGQNLRTNEIQLEHAFAMTQRCVHKQMIRFVAREWRI